MGLRIRRVSTKKDLDEVFRLRYRVYCASSGENKPSDLRPEDYPDGRETDQWDDYAVHFAAFDNGKAVGCLRLILGSCPFGFLMETAFKLPLDLNRKRGVEASRMAVDPVMRSRGLKQKLDQAAMKWSLKNGYIWWCVAIRTFLLPPSRKAGWRIREIGKPVIYHDVLVQPIIVYLREKDYKEYCSQKEGR
ncbi:MAG: GNAT family N-acetyltransferase [Candidatus Nealsonbacteria bacterium]|nr:GNAT family N-acetyltransferase [Candidatus Nealsonbacteria bacterium]